MCLKFRIMSIQEAQDDAGMHPSSMGYRFYWRTSHGYLRQTGWVASCECRKFQYWGPTKTKVALAVLRNHKNIIYLAGMPSYIAKKVIHLRYLEVKGGYNGQGKLATNKY